MKRSSSSDTQYVLWILITLPKGRPTFFLLSVIFSILFYAAHILPDAFEPFFCYGMRRPEAVHESYRLFTPRNKGKTFVKFGGEAKLTGVTVCVVFFIPGEQQCDQ